MKILFVGNRPNVLTELISMNDSISIVSTMVLKDSYLECLVNEQNIEHEMFTLSDKQIIINKIKSTDFDILISNGCPFVLPVSEIKQKHQNFINIHPTYLPYLRGKTPINGVFYNQMSFFGATMHFMDDGIDTGPIIYQEKVELTSDVDLAMLYYMSFKLEGIVFKKGFVDHVLKGKTIVGSEPSKGSEFNRNFTQQRLNFSNSNRSILSIIKAFGVSSQGSRAIIDSREIVVFAASEVINSTFLSWFANESVGNIVLELDGSIYVKTKEGIIKLTRYKWCDIGD